MNPTLIARVQAMRGLSNAHVASGRMWTRYVTREQLSEALEPINRRLKNMADSQQANVDADAAQAEALNAKLVTVQQEIDALKAQPGGQALDFSRLDAALASDSAQADVDVADAAPATPPPAGP